MFGLTPLGVFHTAVSLVALAAGATSLVRYKEISPRTMAGKLYILSTVIVCLTGFGIFQHGGFGKAHVLGIITLVVLGIAGLAGSTVVFGGPSRYVEALAYSLTFFFHMIPTVNESVSRLPPSAPLFPNPEVPPVEATVGVIFLVAVIGMVLQVRGMRRQHA